MAGADRPVSPGGFDVMKHSWRRISAERFVHLIGMIGSDVPEVFRIGEVVEKKRALLLPAADETVMPIGDAIQFSISPNACVRATWPPLNNGAANM